MTRTNRLRRTAAWAGGMAVLVVGWLAIGAGGALLAAPGRSYAVLGSSPEVIESISRAGGSLVDRRGLFTIARSDEAGFVGRLYRGGIWLVLDATDAGGCSGAPPPS